MRKYGIEYRCLIDTPTYFSNDRVYLLYGTNDGTLFFYDDTNNAHCITKSFLKKNFAKLEKS